MQTKGLNLILPELDKEYSLKNDNELFEHICKKELEEKLKNISKEKHEFYQDRLNYEIEIFKNYNLTGYMLIARDFIKYTRKTNILYVSRGSLGCSLAAYILNITQFDPIKYDLVFERFFNPKDIRLPNISFDFDPEAKDKILKYLVKKFGKDSIVNQIGIIKFLTFEFLSLKTVFEANRIIVVYAKNHLFACPSKKVFDMAKGVISVYDEILATNSKLFAISIDTVESQKKFVEEYDIPYLHLSDTQKDACKKYPGTNIAGLAKRATFIIDKNGTIKNIFRDIVVKNHGKEQAF